MEQASSASDHPEIEEGTRDQSTLASCLAEVTTPDSEPSDSSSLQDQVEIRRADLQQQTQGEEGPSALGGSSASRDTSVDPVTTPESEASGSSTGLQVITKSEQLDTEGAVDREEGQQPPQGYDFKLVDETVREEYECPICTLIARKPAKVSCCGQIYCNACIAKQTECPLCRETFQSIIDKRLERKIQHQQVYCVNQDKGCEWIGELGHVWAYHLQDPTNQPQQPGTQRCLHQLTTCKKCDQELMYIDLDHHMDSVCEHRMVTCKYQFAGCRFKGPKINRKQHMEEKTATHLALVTRKLQCCYWFTLIALVIALILTLSIAVVGVLHQQVNDKSAYQEVRIDNLVSQLNDQASIITKLMAEVHHLESEINRMQSESFLKSIIRSVLPRGFIL